MGSGSSSSSSAGVFTARTALGVSSSGGVLVSRRRAAADDFDDNNEGGAPPVGSGARVAAARIGAAAMCGGAVTPLRAALLGPGARLVAADDAARADDNVDDDAVYIESDAPDAMAESLRVVVGGGSGQVKEAGE